MGTETGGKKVTIRALEDFCAKAMRKAGMLGEDAAIAAEVLARTDSWGTFTHGTRQLGKLLKNFRDGKMDLGAVAEIVAEGPSFAVFDGHHGMPIVASAVAMRTVISKAKATGIAIATIRDSGHFGAAGYYADLAARNGCIGISMCNVDAGVAVPGSRGPVLGTNPLSYAAPLGEESVFLDIATSVVAASKVFRAQARGESIPDGWLIDKDGVPTTNPVGYPQAGALQPMSGHKGYGIALMVEILTGVLGGGAFGKDVVSWIFGDHPVNQSMCFIAIDITGFMPLGLFEERMGALARQIHESPKAVGADRIFLPGEMEWEKAEASRTAGILLPTDVVSSLEELAAEYGLDGLPWEIGDGR